MRTILPIALVFGVASIGVGASCGQAKQIAKTAIDVEQAACLIADETPDEPSAAATFCSVAAPYVEVAKPLVAAKKINRAKRAARAATSTSVIAIASASASTSTSTSTSASANSVSPSFAKLPTCVPVK
jgi:hypothetical protein